MLYSHIWNAQIFTIKMNIKMSLFIKCTLKWQIWTNKKRNSSSFFWYCSCVIMANHRRQFDKQITVLLYTHFNVHAGTFRRLRNTIQELSVQKGNSYISIIDTLCGAGQLSSPPPSITFLLCAQNSKHINTNVYMVVITILREITSRPLKASASLEELTQKKFLIREKRLSNWAILWEL